MQPMVRVRFLVALVVLFGLLASAAGAVAAQKSRDADEWQTLYRAQDALQQTAWPKTFALVRELEGCRPSATSVCLVSTDSPADAARAAAAVLPVTSAEPAARVGAEHRHLTGLVGERVVRVDVRKPMADDDVPPGGSRVTVMLEPAP